MRNSGSDGSSGSFLPVCPACGAHRIDRQLGQERLHDCKTRECGECYVCRMCAVFDEVWRVLRRDGVCFINLGDSYAREMGKGQHKPGDSGKEAYVYDNGGGRASATADLRLTGLKPKDLCGIPWRVALALQERGWYLRSDIIWAKSVSGEESGGSTMPESTEDRCTKAHEYLFMLTKSERYYFDYVAIMEDAVTPAGTKGAKASEERAGEPGVNSRPPEYYTYTGKRRRRDVWQVRPASYKGAHFAVMPEALVEPCILAATSERGVCPTCGAPWVRVVWRTEEVDFKAKGSRFDHWKTAVNGEGRAQDGERFLTKSLGFRPTCRCYGTPAWPKGKEFTEEKGELLGLYHRLPAAQAVVLDPFLGSGTTAVVARRYGRRCIGVDLNPKYAEMAERRIRGVMWKGAVDESEDLFAIGEESAE